MSIPLYVSFGTGNAGECMETNRIGSPASGIVSHSSIHPGRVRWMSFTQSREEFRKRAFFIGHLDRITFEYFARAH